MIHIDDILKEIEADSCSALFCTPPVYDEAKSFVFHSPFRIIAAKNISEVEDCFREVEAATKTGAIAYGMINYECGFLFEKKLSPLLKQKHEKLLSFYLFDEKNFELINSNEIIFSDWKPESFSINNFSLNKSREKYENDILKIKENIAAGNTYQVNYTVKGNFDFSGSTSDLFKSLLFNQSAQYTAFINTGEKIILSISPELFFESECRQIKTRPMKGTIKRAYNQPSDEIAFQSLSNSEKNKAENVMIVDLLRNDLGRISEFGSVKVDELFSIEKYETLFQMTSTINAELRKDITLFDIFKNIFPCGSITGAPKISTMGIINEIESESRGLYTGAIGIVSKEKSVFNVAIRTIEISKKNNAGVIGLGSGIVWDSEPQKEYEETLLKCEFLTKPVNQFQLFETLLIEKGNPVFFDEHLDRLKRACEHFLFLFDEQKIRTGINDAIKNLDKIFSYKLKIISTKWGGLEYLAEEYIPFNAEVKIKLSAHQTNSSDTFVYFKTTNRKLYDAEYQRYNADGFFDVIFANEKMHVTEGAITNIFVVKNNKWVTPPLYDGLLNGIYRHLLMVGRRDIEETSIQVNDLLTADNIYLTNSVRGLVKINKLVLPDNGEIIYS